MPVIIEPADWPLWLGEAEGDVKHCFGRRRGRAAVLAGREEGWQRPERRP